MLNKRIKLLADYIYENFIKINFCCDLKYLIIFNIENIKNISTLKPK